MEGVGGEVPEFSRSHEKHLHVSLYMHQTIYAQCELGQWLTVRQNDIRAQAYAAISSARILQVSCSLGLRCAQDKASLQMSGLCREQFESTCHDSLFPFLIQQLHANIFFFPNRCTRHKDFEDCVSDGRTGDSACSINEAICSSNF